MESDGMRKGSNRNERITSTSRDDREEKERAYSTAMGSRTRSAGVPADARGPHAASLGKEQPVKAPDHPRQCADHHQHQAEVDRFVAEQPPQHGERQCTTQRDSPQTSVQHRLREAGGARDHGCGRANHPSIRITRTQARLSAQ